jgi:hypothetical protein
LTPTIGYPTAPFKINAFFLDANDTANFTFTSAGSTTPEALTSAPADAAGQVTVMTRVPADAAAGDGKVTVTGNSASGSATFNVPS